MILQLTDIVYLFIYSYYFDFWIICMVAHFERFFLYCNIKCDLVERVRLVDVSFLYLTFFLVLGCTWLCILLHFRVKNVWVTIKLFISKYDWKSLWASYFLSCFHISYWDCLWSWSYGSWIYNYLCNQCLSSLKLWFRTPVTCDRSVVFSGYSGFLHQ